MGFPGLDMDISEPFGPAAPHPYASRRRGLPSPEWGSFLISLGLPWGFFREKLSKCPESVQILVTFFCAHRIFSNPAGFEAHSILNRLYILEMPGKFRNAEKRRPEVEIRVENLRFLGPEFRKWMKFPSILDAKFAISGGPKNVIFSKILKSRQMIRKCWKRSN